MNKNLVLIGGGGHCRAVLDVAESAGYKILGILDRPDKVGTSVFGHRIIGTDDDILKYVNVAEFIITVGFVLNPSSRIRLYEMIKGVGGRLATIVASTAYVSKYSTIGEGSVIMHKAVVNADSEIGSNCIVNTMADVDHGAVIGDFTHLSGGVLIGGETKVGNRCFCGIGSCVSHAVSIVSDVILGAGTLVVKDITESGIYCGHPAKFLKKTITE